MSILCCTFLKQNYPCQSRSERSSGKHELHSKRRAQTACFFLAEPPRSEISGQRHSNPRGKSLQKLLEFRGEKAYNRKGEGEKTFKFLLLSLRPIIFIRLFGAKVKEESVKFLRGTTNFRLLKPRACAGALAILYGTAHSERPKWRS